MINKEDDVILALERTRTEHLRAKLQASSDIGFSDCIRNANKAEKEGKIGLAKGIRGLARIIQETARRTKGITDPAIRLS